MRVNSMKDYVKFYSETQSGPYPGMGSDEELFESWAEIYEPSQKDIQLGNLEDTTVSITVIIRNVFPGYVPTVNHTFVVQTGMYKDIKFNIRRVSPANSNTIKVVGTEWA